SLQLAAITAILALLMGLFIIYSKRLRPTLLLRGSVRVLGLGYAIPGTVIAVGVLIPFAWFDNTLDTWMRGQFNVSTGLLISGTLVAVIFAYLVRFLPVALNTLDAGLGNIRPTMDDAGRSMGLKPWQILRRIHMPIMRGSLLTASLLVFVDVLKELPATLILRPFNFNTLAIRTYELANQERLAEAACSALMIVLAGIIPVIILSQSISRSRPGQWRPGPELAHSSVPLRMSEPSSESSLELPPRTPAGSPATSADDVLQLGGVSVALDGNVIVSDVSFGL